MLPQNQKQRQKIDECVQRLACCAVFEPQGWLKLFEDPVIGEALVDRLIHPCQKITLKGEKSYREKLSEKKTGLRN
jgi:DNA replication protein DnaC